MLLLAQQLDLASVAEGIETVTQRDILARLGCQYGQGYWFDRPLSPADAEHYIQASLANDCA